MGLGGGEGLGDDGPAGGSGVDLGEDVACGAVVPFHGSGGVEGGDVGGGGGVGRCALLVIGKSGRRLAELHDPHDRVDENDGAVKDEQSARDGHLMDQPEPGQR